LPRIYIFFLETALGGGHGGACNEPPSRGQRTGNPGNVRHDLARSIRAVNEPKKIVLHSRLDPNTTCSPAVSRPGRADVAGALPAPALLVARCSSSAAFISPHSQHLFGRTDVQLLTRSLSRARQRRRRCVPHSRPNSWVLTADLAAPRRRRPRLQPAVLLMWGCPPPPSPRGSTMSRGCSHSYASRSPRESSTTWTTYLLVPIPTTARTELHGMRAVSRHVLCGKRSFIVARVLRTGLQMTLVGCATT